MFRPGQNVVYISCGRPVPGTIEAVRRDSCDIIPLARIFCVTTVNNDDIFCGIGAALKVIGKRFQDNLIHLESLRF